MRLLSRFLFWTGFVGGAYRVYQQFPQWIQGWLLTAGRDETGRKLLRTLPSSAKTAHNYIAGTTLADALAVAAHLNEADRTVSLTRLGEMAYNHQAIPNRNRMAELLTGMSDNDVEGDITIMPSLLGMQDSVELAWGNLKQLLDQAAGRMVWLDTEDHQTATNTLKLYQQARDAGYTNVGVTVQCGLYRAWGDLNRLAKLDEVQLRLAVGLPNEPSEHGFQRIEDGRANLIRCINFALAQPNINVSVMSTDMDVLQATMDGIRAQGVAKSGVQFVLPFNVVTDLQAHLVAEGYKLSVYLPYGEAWERYLTERLADNPADAILLLGNL